MCDNKHQGLPFDSFLKLCRGIPINAEKCLWAIPADSWPLHGVMEPQVNHNYCIRSQFFYPIKFYQQMSSGANDQAKDLQYSAFRDHGWGHVALYPRWPHVLIGKLFQPSHNCVIPTVKLTKRDILTQNIALIYDLHQCIHNFKSNAPL